MFNQIYNEDCLEGMKRIADGSVDFYKQAVHLTSATDKKVAEKIEKVSQEIFEKNREAYRILANS